MSRPSFPVNNIWIICILYFCLSSCATIPRGVPPDGFTAFAAKEGEDIISRYAPLFVIEGDDLAYNRIGTAKALTDEEGREKVYIDPEYPAIYYEERSFATGRGIYKNLVYRVHFEKVPFSLIPFYLGMGDNVGLFVIVTLNDIGEPLLYTAVHTCGCYIAFLPTNYLPEDAFPEKWEASTQQVFGEHLPGILNFPGELSDDYRPSFLIRSGSHRVRDVWVENLDHWGEKYRIMQSELMPMDSLTMLPLGEGEYTSFYETEGSRKGYVKGSRKTWERLLMSWWALDWRIGEDKYLGKDKKDGPLFYTSLKPWTREESDMRDFAGFLNYWGWGL